MRHLRRWLSGKTLNETSGTMLTLDQVADQFGVSRRTVERWVARKKIAVVRMSRKCVRVRPVEVDRVIERKTILASGTKGSK